jgi:signal transduction histidine kinase
VTGRDDRSIDQVSIARLWAQAAHDLRQPVQAALLLTKMLEVEPAQGKQKPWVRHVAVALHSLNEMLETLALLSRIEAGLQVVSLRTCQLSDVLEATLREIAEIAAERGIPLRLRNMRGMVRTNPKLLATATRSLLLNAIKFGTGDGIIARCRRRGSQLRLEVQFAGTSFDAAIQRNAFVQLLPTDDRPIATELGLGVSLLEYLCRQLGHSLYYTKSSPTAQQLLAIELSLATASS